jgi:hypothetical protein
VLEHPEEITIKSSLKGPKAKFIELWNLSVDLKRTNHA